MWHRPTIARRLRFNSRTDSSRSACTYDEQQVGQKLVNAELSRLEIVNISKSFRSRKVVDSVSLHVDSGEIIGLLGPNGAGKTTCFNSVIGLEKCDSGSVLLDGEDISNLPMYARARKGVGYLPQDSSIFRNLTVEENITAMLETIKLSTFEERRECLQDLLEEFQIEHLRNQKASTLSGGERRRVEIARALALEPRFILLDEPFAGVDPIAVIELTELLQMLCQRNVGFLITDHNVRETLTVCTRAHIMNAGIVIASGTAEQILANDDAKKFYLGVNFHI